MGAFKSSLVPNPSERQSPLIWAANSGSPHMWCFPITAYQIHTSLATLMRTLSEGDKGREHFTHSLWKFTAHLHCAQTKRYNLCREKKIYDLRVINLHEQSTNSLLTLSATIAWFPSAWNNSERHHSQAASNSGKNTTQWKPTDKWDTRVASTL
jgi:hypothetical protein